MADQDKVPVLYKADRQNHGNSPITTTATEADILLAAREAVLHWMEEPKNLPFSRTGGREIAAQEFAFLVDWLRGRDSLDWLADRLEGKT